MATTIGEWLTIARQTLKESAFDDDVDLTLHLLLQHHLHQSRAWLLTQPNAVLSSDHVTALNHDLTRIAAGFPLPYLLGEWEFYGISLSVSPDVLIPRPETELLVETAIHWLSNHAWQQPPKVLDIGTGSGAIAIAIAKHVEKAHVFASDISLRALRLCQTNLHLLNMVDRVQLLASDGFPSLQTQFDLVCANLPYIPSTELNRLAVSKHEPWLALDGGDDGFAIIQQVFSQIQNHLADKYLLLLEIESSQSQLAYVNAQDAFPYSKIDISKDLASNDRLLSIESL